MPRGRAAALAALALLAAGCGSNSSTSTRRLPATGPSGVMRIGLAHILWPLDPARATNRDEIAIARTLFATPLRTDARGALRAGLCSSWEGKGPDLAAPVPTRGRDRGNPQTPPTAPGREHRDAKPPRARRHAAEARPQPALPPHRGRGRTGGGARPVQARLREPRARRRRAGRPDARLPQARAARGQRLLQSRRARRGAGPRSATSSGSPAAPDLSRQSAFVAFSRSTSWPRSPAERLRGCRRCVACTTAPPTAPTTRRSCPSSRPRLRPASTSGPGRRSPGPPSSPRARPRSRSAPCPAWRSAFAEPGDPDDAYGASLLVAAWRDLGLGPYFGKGRPDARFERVLAAYPRPDAIRAALRDRPVIPIAWAVDARLVSPRVRGWSEDGLGAVDYARVRLRGPSRSR